MWRFFLLFIIIIIIILPAPLLQATLLVFRCSAASQWTSNRALPTSSNVSPSMTFACWWEQEKSSSHLLLHKRCLFFWCAPKMKKRYWKVCLASEVRWHYVIFLSKSFCNNYKWLLKYESESTFFSLKKKRCSDCGSAMLCNFPLGLMKPRRLLTWKIWHKTDQAALVRHKLSVSFENPFQIIKCKILIVHGTSDNLMISKNSSP